MANYGRIRVVPEVASSSDYRSKLAQLAPIEFENATPTKQVAMSVAPGTGGLTIDLNMFSTILAAVLVNRSVTAAEVVNARWYAIRGTQSAGVAPNSFTYTLATNSVADNGAHGTFVTNGAAVFDYMRSSGTLSNNGLYPVITAGANSIVASPSTPFANETSETAVLTFLARNWQGIAPNSGPLVLTDNIAPSEDLILTSESGTPTVDAFIFGT